MTRGRPRARWALSVLAVAASALVVGAGPARALWTDTGGVAFPTSSAATLVPPASTTCTAGLTTATIGWSQSDPRYRYTVALYRTGTPRTLVDGPTLLAAGQTSVSYSALLTVGTTYEVDVRSAIAGTSWTSATARTSQRFVLGVLGGCQ